MDKDNIEIMDASEQDFTEIQSIYAHYVQASTVTLEETSPDVAEMLKRWKNSTDKALPYIVAKLEGKIVGYAYAFPYRPRSAYRFMVEESVYVHPKYMGYGIGKKLLTQIIDTCTEKGYKQMLAVIAGSDNVSSIKAHEKMGFVECGLIKRAGFKHEKWIDTVLMQREL